MSNPKTDIIKKEFTDGIPGHVVQARYFYFDTPKPEDASLYILCGGHEQCAPDFALNRRNLAFYTLKYTLGGKGTFICQGKTCPLGFGSLTAFGPQTPHQFQTDPQDPMEHIFIVFMGRQAEELLRASVLGAARSLRVSNPQYTASVIGQILKIGLEKPPYAQDICGSYVRALLLEQGPVGPEAVPGSSRDSFQKCKLHLDRYFMRIASAAQLAEECCLDIRYIARLFRQYQQMRPHDYLMQLKMNKAANLLLTTNFSIKQIAQMAGVEDPYHFSRLFKKKFNIAPTEYRNGFYSAASTGIQPVTE